MAKPRRETQYGYLVVTIPGRGIVFEHRLIMERHIGRALTNDEVVHHVNGNRQDNRIENLQIMSRAEHSRLHNAARPWARAFDACTECGTTRFAHKGHGLCESCWGRRWRKQQPTH